MPYSDFERVKHAWGSVSKNMEIKGFFIRYRTSKSKTPLYTCLMESVLNAMSHLTLLSTISSPHESVSQRLRDHLSLISEETGTLMARGILKTPFSRQQYYVLLNR